MNHHEGNVFLINDFDDNLEQTIVVPLATEVGRQSGLKGGMLDLWVNSIGGYLHLAHHIIELMEAAKRQGVTVRTIVPSMAFSAGSMVAVAGSRGHRYIGRRAEHLVHYGQVLSFETTQEQVKRFSAWKNRQFEGNLEHYRKYCSIPELDKQILDDGWFIPANKAIKWGMADKYTDRLEVHAPLSIRIESPL